MKCGTLLLGHLCSLVYAATASAGCVVAEQEHTWTIYIYIICSVHGINLIECTYAQLCPRSYHTAGRDAWNDYRGNEGYTFVQIGNMLCARVVLLMLLCVCRGCRFLVEQPEGSTLADTPRFQWFLSVAKVAWMRSMLPPIGSDFMDCVTSASIHRYLNMIINLPAL